MRATLTALVLLALTSCATTQPTATAPAPPKSTAICLPCVMPCTPDSSCGPTGGSRVAVTTERLELKERIHFDTSKATIKPVSYTLLDEVAAALKSHDEVKRTRIEGHTDTVGEADFNKQLSQQRAEAVREYLIDKGVSASRLEAHGYGAEKPVASNDTEEGREANRRVEFRISN